jgi:hypothetical protein
MRFQRDNRISRGSTLKRMAFVEALLHLNSMLQADAVRVNAGLKGNWPRVPERDEKTLI